MIIRHNLPNNKFTKLDRRVFSNSKLSDGAVRLYGYMCSLRNGANFSDQYLLTALSISKRALYNRKKELKEADLILIDQISARVYVASIGYTDFTARQVKNLWRSEEDTGNDEEDRTSS